MQLVYIYNTNDIDTKKYQKYFQYNFDWVHTSELKQQYKLSGYADPTSFPWITDLDTGIGCKIDDVNINFFKHCNLKPYQVHRLMQYEKKGINIYAWILALIEKEVDGNAETWNSFILEKEAIKKEIQKPVEDIEDAKIKKISDISRVAEQFIQARIDTRKQAKIGLQAISLLKKQIEGGTLTQAEAALVAEMLAYKELSENIHGQEAGFIAEVNEKTKLNDVINYTFNYSEE